MKEEDDEGIENQYRGHNPYWFSSLFNEIYLRNDVPKKYKSFWETDHAFEIFHQNFHNFVLETKNEAFETWSESDTIKNWIVHIMEMLGWHDKCESQRQNPYISELSLTISEDGRKRTYRADLVYVDEPKFKQYVAKETRADDRLREARSEHTGALMILEAKYWDRLEHTRQNRQEEKIRSDVAQDDGTRHLDPNDQILKYMDILHRDFGILTDGKTWRLFNRELSRGDVRRYYEFDLGNLAQLVRDGLDNEKSRERFLQEARYFYYFFRKASLVQQDSSVPFVHEVLEYSKKYASSIEEDLKTRFIHAMGCACNSLKTSFEKSGEKVDLDLIRNLAESHLFNILFIRSCESRKILPIGAPAYHKLSLTEVIETLDHMNFDPEKELETFLRFLKLAFGSGFQLDGTEVYDRLLRLYRVVHDGDMGFEVSGFKETFFTKDEWNAAQRHKIDSKSMLLILFSLNFTESEFGSRKYQQIPYNFFTPRQLGSIYESFLEFKLETAKSYMVFHKRQWRTAEKSSDQVKGLLSRGVPKVEKGELYFTPDNRDRKMTGSYYTPDFIVEYIVKETLGPLCRGKASKVILGLSICDPAMGSGHFLSGALNYLTDAYRQALAEETISDVNEQYELTARRVLDACIYGVDINPRAVKLAKMSLWLASACVGKKLERLDDQIKVGDSLVDDLPGYSGSFSWAKEFDGVNFDAIIGNPPWVSILGKFKAQGLDDVYTSYLIKKYNLDTNRPNIYEAFVRRGLSLIKVCPASIFGMILPEGFGMNKQFTDLRYEILKDFRIERVAYGFDFPGVTMDTGIFIISNNPSSNYYVGGIYPKIDQKISIKEIENDKRHTFNISRVLNGVQNGSSAELLACGNLCQSFTGTIAGKNQLLDSKAPGLNVILKGRDIQPFVVVGSHYIKLEKASFIGGTQNIAVLTSRPKVLLRKTGAKLIACLDEVGIAIEQSLYGLWNFRSDIDPRLIVCFFNSASATRLYMDRFVTNRSTTPQLKKMHLDQFPIPVDGLIANSALLLKLYDTIRERGFGAEQEALLNELMEEVFSQQRDEVAA